MARASTRREAEIHQGNPGQKRSKERKTVRTTDAITTLPRDQYARTQPAGAFKFRESMPLSV
jgi:hypothetical protein